MRVTFTTTDLGEARLLANAGRYKAILTDFDEYLRSGIKYNERPWQEIRDTLWGLIHEWNVTMEDDYEPTEESDCSCGRAPGPNGDGGES